MFTYNIPLLSLSVFNIYADNLTKINNYAKRLFVVIYADDILLITPSFADLQNLLRMFKTELTF